jgi:hypothetical protein
MPNAFYRHARALGLDATDVGLISALETRRVIADDPVYVSYRKLANEIKTSEDTISRRVEKWVAAGLVEKEHRRREDGGNSTCALTRRGLTRALALIDGNLVRGREATIGLDDLLVELKNGSAPHPQNAGAPTRNLRVPHPQNAGAEEEPLEEEPREEEPLTRRDLDRDLLEGCVTEEREGALIEALKEAFDAEVLSEEEAAEYRRRGTVLDLTMAGARNGSGEDWLF